MSKKSNNRRTQRQARRKGNGNRQPRRQESDVLAEQMARRKAATRAKLAGTKTTFTRGAKALLASFAIMVMFIAGLVSWSVIRTVRNRRDDQTITKTSMVTSDLVTGISRRDAKSLDATMRFNGFMESPKGIDGADLLGGHVIAVLSTMFASERDALTELWEERQSQSQRDDETDDAQSQLGMDVAEIRKETRSGSDASAAPTEGIQASDADPGAQDTQDASAPPEATDEQVTKLIESARNSSSL